MSKARSMYAGSSGMVNGTNAMIVQIGNKLQGLPPTTNKPAELINHITTKAQGDKRDYIFCINQLAGGVGRNVGQFTQGADGVKECTNGKFELKPNNCEFLNFQELNKWVDTELSSLFATMSQGAGNIVSNNTTAAGYLGMAVVPSAMLGSGGIYSAVAGGNGALGTIISWMIDITAFAEPSATFASVTNNGGIPDLDIVPFLSGVPSNTTITNLNADNTSFPQSNNMPDFVSALQSSVDANPTVKQTLASLFGKDLLIDGYGTQHKLVAYILPERFIGSLVFDNMRQWISNAQVAGDRNAPIIWVGYHSIGGAYNGLTYGINTRHTSIARQYRTNFIHTCDLGGHVIPGSSDAVISGSTPHISGSYVLNNTIPLLSLFRIE